MDWKRNTIFKLVNVSDIKHKRQREVVTKIDEIVDASVDLKSTSEFSCFHI